MIALLLVIGVALGVWLLRRAPASITVPVLMPPAPSSASAAASAVSVAASTLSWVAAPASSAAKAEATREFVDVCGFGRVKRSELESRDGEPPTAWAQAIDRQAEEGLANVLQRLQAGSVKQRVVAAALRGDAEGAARWAATDADAQTYRLALRACHADALYRSAHAWLKAQPPQPASSEMRLPDMAPPGPVPNACAALSLEKLESLDPDDASPWLTRLQDSLTKGDEAGTAQALYQLGQRPRTAPGARALSEVVADVVGAEPTPGEAFALVHAVGRDMMGFDSAHQSVNQACRAQALRDANRRQLCEQAVRQLPGMTKEFMQARLLHLLEERLGLPHSDAAMSKEELGRAQEAVGAEDSRWMTEPTCANLGRLGRQLVGFARQGELAYVRPRMKGQAASSPR